MKTRPIIFSGPMVRAILEGRKTQTRRVIKPIPAYPDAWDVSMFKEPQFACPYGRHGDHLWVRETWNVIQCRSSYEYGDCSFFPWDWSVDPSEMLCRECKALKGCNTPVLVYAADGEDENPSEMYPGLDFKNGKTFKTKPEISWRPSIHMPRWASRLLLTVTAIRVERLQNISIEDAIYEGINCPVELDEPCKQCGCCEGDEWDNPIQHQCNPRSAFADLWQSINGKHPDCSWENNPWVWVVEFVRVQSC